MYLARLMLVHAFLGIAFAWAAGTSTAYGQTGAAGPEVAVPAPSAQGSANDSVGDAAPPAPVPMWTRYAYFVPARFSDLPGWRDDNLTEAWQALRASCSVLRTRSAWAGACARLYRVNGVDSDEVRRFLEREFVLFQIHNRDRTPTGMITGYYEPLLQGSRRKSERYVYPVYAMPDDLLFLDVRSVPRAAPGDPVYARVEGRAVIPLCAGACEGPYLLDIGNAKPDIRDKKLRVRIDGQRIVTYYTRAQIEQGGLPAARVLAWVDDAAALYSMQVQGSGKVRLPDGQIVRLAYAEQNGHPFTPPVSASRRGTSVAVLTRGISIDVPAGESATAEEPLSPEVERMVELLLKGNSAPQPIAKPGSAAEPAKAQASSGETRPSVVSSAPPTAPRPPATIATIFSSDPSYVFFRQIPDSESGPLGALGVPLTAGRSVAVDPRTTPLGFPVFISTEGQGIGTRVNRLMLAQDTGGAIRGPVRADYFWGFGPGAGQMAGRMRENGRMWLLMPKDLQMTNAAGGIATRGIDAGTGDAECLVPDPDLCVE